jgi:hypothetical protein
MSTDKKSPNNHGSGDQMKSARDANGRWKKGHCPNPKGRPRKRKDPNYDPSDIHYFKNTLIEVRTKDGPQLMDRRAALNNKMFEDAMRGKVSMQRFMYAEFERNDERLAAMRLHYEKLVTKWIINNKEFDGLDGESIPKEVQIELAQLQGLLNHYYPGQYPILFASCDENDDAA